MSVFLGKQAGAFTSRALGGEDGEPEGLIPSRKASGGS